MSTRSQIIKHVIQKHRASDGSVLSEPHAAEVWAMMLDTRKNQYILEIMPAEGREKMMPAEGREHELSNEEIEHHKKTKESLLKEIKDKQKALKNIGLFPENSLNRKFMISELKKLQNEYKLIVELIQADEMLKKNNNEIESLDTYTHNAIHATFGDQETQDSIDMLQLSADSWESKVVQYEKKINQPNGQQRQEEHIKQDKSMSVVMKALKSGAAQNEADAHLTTLDECLQNVANQWNQRRENKILEVKSKENFQNSKLRALRKWYVHEMKSGRDIPTDKIKEQASLLGIETTITTKMIREKKVLNISQLPASFEAVQTLLQMSEKYPLSLIHTYCAFFDKPDPKKLKYRSTFVDIPIQYDDVHKADQHKESCCGPLFLMSNQTHAHTQKLFEDAETSTLRFYTISYENDTTDDEFAYDCVELRDYLLMQIDKLGIFERNDSFYDTVLDETYTKWYGGDISFTEIQFDPLLDYIKSNPIVFSKIVNPAHTQLPEEAAKYFTPTMVYNALSYFKHWQVHHCELRHGIVDLEILSEFDDMYASFGTFVPKDKNTPTHEFFKSLGIGILNKVNEFWAYVMESTLLKKIGCIFGTLVVVGVNIGQYGLIGSMVAGVGSVSAAITAGGAMIMAAVPSLSTVAIVAIVGAFLTVLVKLLSYVIDLNPKNDESYMQMFMRISGGLWKITKTIFKWIFSKFCTVTGKIMTMLDGLYQYFSKFFAGPAEGIVWLEQWISQLYTHGIRDLRFFPGLRALVDIVNVCMGTTIGKNARRFVSKAVGSLNSVVNLLKAVWNVFSANVTKYALFATSIEKTADMTQLDVGAVVYMGGLQVIYGVGFIQNIYCEWKVLNDETTRGECDNNSKWLESMFYAQGYTVKMYQIVRMGWSVGSGSAIMQLFCIPLVTGVVTDYIATSDQKEKHETELKKYLLLEDECVWPSFSAKKHAALIPQYLQYVTKTL
jgi:hypothetical protein